MDHKRIVTPEGQLRILDEIIATYRNMGVGVEWELKTVSLHSLIATQDAIEADKFQIVRRKVQAGQLQIPVIVEEHFTDDRTRYYLLDGHCRTRALIELGRQSTQAYVLWPMKAGFESNFVKIAAQYGNVLLKDLKMI
jgi:hypothetical protein